jgi:hypothetical protein
MTTEFNELLPDRAGDKVQIWIIGDCKVVCVRGEKVRSNELTNL